jgi:hypothetical protein
MRFTFDQLTQYLADLILTGATEVWLECAHGQPRIIWQFPGEKRQSLLFELEEPC